MVPRKIEPFLAPRSIPQDTIEACLRIGLGLGLALELLAGVMAAVIAGIRDKLLYPR